jgi:hypothetical protein
LRTVAGERYRALPDVLGRAAIGGSAQDVCLAGGQGVDADLECMRDEVGVEEPLALGDTPDRVSELFGGAFLA